MPGAAGRVFNDLMRSEKFMINQIRKFINRRRWSANRQIEWMRVHLIDDSQWLAHDPKASAICQRYLAMLSDDWQKVQVEPVSKFRDRIDDFRKPE